MASSLFAEEQREESLRRLGETALCALCALLAAHTQVYGGIAPFGVAATAAGSNAALPVGVAAAIGYLLWGDTITAMRYIAAVAAVIGIRFTLGGFDFLKGHRLFIPLTAAAATLITGLALGAIGGLSLSVVSLVLVESTLCGCFAYFFHTAVDTVLQRDRSTFTTEQRTAVAIVTAVLLVSVSASELGGISPGRILTVLLILCCAYAGHIPGGAVAGVVFAAASVLVGNEGLPVAVTYALGGLLAGLFARFGKWAALVALFCGQLLMLLDAAWSVDTLIGIYETVAAGMLFLVIPRVFYRRFSVWIGGGEEPPAVEGLRRSVSARLGIASKAMAEVAGTVDAVSKRLAGVSAPDLGSVYFGVSDEICRRCGMRMLCWEREMNDTMDAFNHFTRPLRERGKVCRDDAVGRLAESCTHLDEVLGEVNRGYAEHRLRESAWRRLADIRAVVTDQFLGVSELLTEFSRDIAHAERIDADASARVRQVCEQYGIEVEQALCFVHQGGRMQVEIEGSDSAAKLRQKEWLREIGATCGREFAPPHTERTPHGVKIRLRENTRYTVRIGSAQLPYGDERLCGDAFESFEDGNGVFRVVLSDGMGSGGRAAVDGAMAAGLTARLFSAGFGADSVLRMVNSALMVKSGDESLATLDILALDLYTGKTELLKAGAATSLLLSKGCVSRMENSSLPVGILRDISFDRQTDTLTEGDVLLMCSDGVFADGIGWVERELEEFDAAACTLRELAERIACHARERSRKAQAHEDDITVLAIRVERTRV